MRVVVDTSAFVALALGRDQRHTEATALYEHLQNAEARLLTTEWVFGETVTFLRRRAGYETARDAGEALRSSAVLEIVNPDAQGMERAWDLFLGYRFGGLSLTDCVSFAEMRRRRLRTAFTFDQHFVDAGFELLATPDE